MGIFEFVQEHPFLASIAVYWSLVIFKFAISCKTMAVVVCVHVAEGKVQLEDLPDSWSESGKLRLAVSMYLVGGFGALLFTVPKVMWKQGWSFFIPHTYDEAVNYGKYGEW